MGACLSRLGRGLGWHLLARTAQPCLAWSLWVSCPRPCAHGSLLSSPLHSLHPHSGVGLLALDYVCVLWPGEFHHRMQSGQTGFQGRAKVLPTGLGSHGGCVGDTREVLYRGLPPLALLAIPSPIHPQAGISQSHSGRKSVPNFFACPGRAWGKTFPGWHLGTASGSYLLRGLFCN